MTTATTPVEVDQSIGAGPPEVRWGTGLVDFLRVERLDLNLFRGWCHGGSPMRAMGGQVVAQALAAAGHTVDPERKVHSLHGYFLRGGDIHRPVYYTVERLRDGRSFSARRVDATQDGRPIFTLTTSFKSPEEGAERQTTMPDVPPPDDLTDAFECWAELKPESFLESKYAHVTSMRVAPLSPNGATWAEEDGQLRQAVWFRTKDPLPDDPLLHACALTYCSDITLPQTSGLNLELLYPLRAEPSKVTLASLDHAVWFHRPFRTDDWLLFAQRSTSRVDGRGFNLGEFWTREGTLVASVTQEAAIRPRRSAGPAEPKT
ncbi:MULTISPECIES: acyl-CoA thioesterase [unclassified Rhodococcus (in: high G+C Gram-positive bacteria)]|uniref:acyl-CoA thioesterase n=1 Tax=unclassified Rhodococcus (in: high G+C Gram-positive bacteria) TaxID=192944 RepID=UPI00037CDC4A|nr:acyl-CoA thioesterase II [Rhodococcus sp. DK17]